MEPGTERSNEAFVRAALAGTRFKEVRWVAETGSTNDDLLLVAREGAGEQVLITDLQTTGRGRRDRVWHAPAGSGILMSVLIRGMAPTDAFWAVGAVSLAASQTIDTLIDSDCTLKWPNDVLIDDGDSQRKVAGVLAQLAHDVVIVGIGINVNWPEQMPAEVRERGTAVNRHRSDHSEPDVERAPMAAEILTRAIGHLASDRQTLRRAWSAQCSTLGQRVRLELDHGEIVGNAVEVTLDGALQIEEEGRRTAHQVGDVVHLRPSD